MNRQPDETPDVTHIRNPDVTHEMSDVNVSWILRFCAGLFIGTAIVFVLMWKLFGFFNDREVSLQQPAGPLAVDERQLPPEPRLQLAPGHSAHPLDEMKEMIAEQDRVLNSYGWVDREAGIARIPIDQAKRLVVERAAKPVGERVR